MTQKLKDTEMDLFHKWKSTGKKTYFQQLYRSFKPLLFKASQRAARGSSIPSAAFELEAAQRFHDAVSGYDPSKGTQLQTHVFGTVTNKLKRLLSDYQDIGRIPERSGAGLGFYHIGRMNNTKDLLRQQLGREPTSDEVAQKMNVSTEQIDRLSRDVRPDISLNNMVADSFLKEDLAADDDLMNMYYYDMNPEQQQLFDYIRGAHGKAAILKPSGHADYRRIAQAMGTTEMHIHKIRADITKMMKG